MKPILRLLLLSVLMSSIVSTAHAARSANNEPASALAAPCPRYAEGSVVAQPADLYSSRGVLTVKLTYRTRVAPDGNRLYCFTDDKGNESPTLHVRPGDELSILLINALPAELASDSSSGMRMMPSLTISSASNPDCGGMMTNASTNLHFHGTNTSPVCHQDEVIKTLVNPGQTFQYKVKIPASEPPGLYWYHPHVHMLSEAAVQGGASGAIVVEGIENVNPAVAGLPQRILLVRDQLLPSSQQGDPSAPAWNLSVNYVTVPYPKYTPAVIAMKASRKEFWRLVNASADTLLDLQLRYDGVAQNLEVVALDGVPTGSQDGTSQGKSQFRNHIVLPPAGRAEFLVTPPAASVRNAVLLTHKVDTGPDGDNDPRRTLATLKTTPNWAVESVQMPVMPAVSDRGGPQLFEGLAEAVPSKKRTLYFSEDNPASQFFITVDGQTPVLFDPNNPPAIVTTQGSVEDWTIQNRTQESHVFHIHQIHFLVLDESNGEHAKDQYLDTIEVPYWSGAGPYPSVTLRMDFRGRYTGDFVYHCHILEHEDAGMMAVIRVLPKRSRTSEEH